MLFSDVFCFLVLIDREKINRSTRKDRHNAKKIIFLSIIPSVKMADFVIYV